MSDVLIVGLISCVPATISAVFAYLNRNKLAELHVSLNSRLSELLTANSAASRAEGKAEGIAEGKIEPPK
jgi:hypothetical protein